MSTQMQTVTTVEHTSKSHYTRNHRRDSEHVTNVNKKRQRNIKNGRKRSKSFTGGGPVKIKNMRPVLPSRFLLGGNIRDPLNLNSLQDEKVNRAMNAVTPKSSPVPTPPRRRGHVEVIIPRNINDPLNLIDCADDAEYEQQLCSPVKKGRKKRVRKKRTSSGTSEVSDAEIIGCVEAKTPESNADSAKIPEVADNTVTKTSKDLSLELSPKKDKNNKRKSEDYKDNVKKLKYFSMDKIVSPVIPQPGSWFKRTNSRSGNFGNVHHRAPVRPPNNGENQKMPVFKERDRYFQYGNYNRYYGYRNPYSEIDVRLKCFSHHPDLLEGKDVLDVGCNIGHITLSVARDFGCRSVVGIDIDKKLIEIARKNVKHYVKNSQTPPHDGGHIHSQKKSSEFYPISMPILYGPIDIPGFTVKDKGQGFPSNVTFKHGNYVLDDDALLGVEQPQFDVILCLSVTKWIHLNWGDAGIKQAFRRMYAQLRRGGKLILEPQNWASYKGKKKLTETIFKNYNNIQFFPDQFTQYLLSAEVGFAKSEILGFPQHQARGFQRPIQVYTKSAIFPSERSESSVTSSYANNKLYHCAPNLLLVEPNPCDSPAVNDEVLCGVDLATSKINSNSSKKDDEMESKENT